MTTSCTNSSKRTVSWLRGMPNTGPSNACIQEITVWGSHRWRYSEAVVSTENELLKNAVTVVIDAIIIRHASRAQLRSLHAM